MKIAETLAVAVVLCGLAACGGPREGANLAEPYHISLALDGGDEGAAFPAMSDLVDSIEYVRLEYVPDLPVGDIDHLCIGRESIFVFDGDAGVFHFTRDGRFVRRVGHIGRGPGEYLRIGGTHVDDAAGILHIVTRDMVLKYELATGKFLGDMSITEADGAPLIAGSSIGQFPSPVGGVAISARGNGFAMAVDGVYPHSWMALDIPAARVVHREPSGVYNAESILPSSVLLPQPVWMNTDGVVTAYENGADTMYAVREDFSRTPRIVVSGGGRLRVPAVMNVDSGVVVSEVKESGRYILFSLLNGMPFSMEPFEMSMMSFDKTTGARAFAKYNSDEWFFYGPVNDIDGGGGAAHLHGYDADTWYAQYDAFRMIENLTPEHFAEVRPAVKYPERLDKLQAFVATLSESDNPVVAIFHIKK